MTKNAYDVQEQLKEAVRSIVDLVKQPFYALRDAISKVLKTVKVVVKRIKQALLAIKRMVLSIRKFVTLYRLKPGKTDQSPTILIGFKKLVRLAPLCSLNLNRIYDI